MNDSKIINLFKETSGISTACIAAELGCNETEVIEVLDEYYYSLVKDKVSRVSDVIDAYYYA